ncbi:hypothetical protein QO009_004073 [Brevibacillus aydinogluensis]|jgi:hypothetical protein|uniref:ATP-binding protein n=1 Tax=Brevibacillus aydinogluensis TaxID=927786 RepID=UPI002892ECB4|nr:ATP-binding protein [Brevibacillus aydinogluensis]MDT3418148.1 hypothetical protein [Brevibacillus aydinogluensis]
MLPVLYMEENRVFDIYGNPYAVYVVESDPYAFQAERVKKGIIDRVARGLSNLTGEFYFYLLNRQLSIKQMTNEMKRYGKHPSWQKQIQKSKDKLQRRLPFNRLNMIVVPLGRKQFSINLTDLELSEATWQEKIKKLLQEISGGVRDVKDKFYRYVEEFSTEVLNHARTQSDDILTKLHGLGRVRMASLQEVEWWLRKSYFRGLPEPGSVIPEPFPVQVMSKGYRQVIRPIKSVVHALADVRVREKLTSLMIEHDEDRVSYQTFYSTVNVPQEIPENDPTGYEWLYGIIETLKFPVDIALHVRIEGPKEALENLKSKKKTAEAQYEEWTDNDNDVPLEVEEDYATVAFLEKKLRSRQPLVHVKTIFALGAPDLKKLKEYSTEFEQEAQKFHVLVRSPGDMKAFFQAFYPFAENSLPTSYEIPMDPGVLAAGVPFGTRALGDPCGFWLGRLLTGRPVFMDPTRAAQINTATAIMLVGKLGSGKSYTMKDIIYHLLSWGAIGFAIDPKGTEFEKFPSLPDLGDEVKIVSFTDGAGTAQFNPFRLGSNEFDSRQAIKGILELIFQSSDPQQIEMRNVVLSMALDTVYQGVKYDMYAFEDALKGLSVHPEPDYQRHAKIVIQRLNILKNDTLGRLLFGEDTGQNIFNKRMLVAIVRGLVLPKAGTSKDKWTDGERLSAAMMFAVATLGLKQLLRLPKHVVKFLAIDESWVLREFEEGRKLYNEALRLSRAENLIPIMASQNATDFEAREGEDDISGLFGWKFIYRLDSKTQVEAALRILGMNEEDPSSWTERFSKYTNGLGMVRDPEGRVGEMQVELVDQSLDQYFGTTPHGGESAWQMG